MTNEEEILRQILEELRRIREDLKEINDSMVTLC
jgi:hypothetical protein